MKPRRPSVERRGSFEHLVIERTPRSGNRVVIITLGLVIFIGIGYVIVSGLPSHVTRLVLDQIPNTPVTQQPKRSSDAPQQSTVSSDPLTLLYGAVVKAELPAVNSLLGQLSTGELNRPLNGMTLLMTTASTGNTEVLQALLAHGASPNARGAHQRTALQYAAEKNRLQAARLLLDAGADIDGADNGSLTPLIMAADRDFTQLALLLIKRGANVNIQNVQGWTALMDAAEVGNMQLVEALLAAGARTEARHHNGFMALDFARRGEHQDVIRLLLGNRPSAGKNDRRADSNHPAMPTKKGERQ